MLSRLDDYPVHQTAEPLTRPVDGDPNRYDRYFFHGYEPDSGTIFAAALGIYPVRGVIDASFTLVRDGHQRSVHASARLPRERTSTVVGPLSVEVIEPLRRLAVRVDRDHDLGLAAELTFEARTPALEEPRHTWRVGGQTIMDSTRVTQWGTWVGSIEADGDVIGVEPSRWRGVRDRSWGIRPVGDPVPGPPPTELPHFFWLWAPVNFDDLCVHAGLNEDPSGRRWYSTGAVVPLLTDGPADTRSADPVGGPPPRHLHAPEIDVRWQRGTRWAERATISFDSPGDDPSPLELTPVATLLMRGLGYTDPDWGHGRYRGDLATGSRAWALADEDPIALGNLHVQQLCRARWGERVGAGVLEILAIGEHPARGLPGFVDGALA